jgi:protease-4
MTPEFFARPSARLFSAALALLFLCGCAAPLKVKLFTDAGDPLREFTLSGDATEKILLVNVGGIISDFPEFDLMRTKPNIVQEIVSQLKLAENDPRVKAVILKINSPGGSATASDIIYNEITGFKARTGRPVVVCMMDIAVSGAYYISLPADKIYAHPTSVTGSVGAVFINPNISGLMGKLGIDVDVNKSGKNKDMCSWFRRPSSEETQIMNGLIKCIGDRFVELTVKHRKLTPESKELTATARVFTAPQAKDIGLIDEIGYFNDALNCAKKLGKAPDNARLVVYRRTEYPNDNIYNISTGGAAGSEPKYSLMRLGVLEDAAEIRPGFYYMWLPALSDR